MNTPELTSNEINEACWAFIEAMPHQLPGPIFNDLKPAMVAAVIRYQEAIATPLPEHADHVSEIAARLRLVAKLAGCPQAVPDNDHTAIGAIFSVLGNMRRELERKQPSQERVAFDPMAEANRIVSASAQNSANDDNWRKLFWTLAKELNCLPSSFVDGNEHVLRKARELQARAATK